ncbi:integral membrane protein S linking to the trans Golgi network-domain-containing protein [Aspergillus pseudoustus]|uniref:Integral membrane protein S linking to the trans Golgi network-domain-containing protein n=1 Tax=Aspergillus pseudoustus TaxID=1810923 RepID=A0ABR4KPX9_9EURO
MPPRRRAPPAGARTDLPPLRIIRQILFLQVAYYISATTLILFTTLVYGTAFSLDLVLSWSALRGDTTIGWMLSLVWILNSLLCVIFLLLFVSRSKLIPDFALTIHLLHLITTSLYTRSIPSNLLWWGLQCASAALMTFLGIWACRYRELQPISFGGIGGNSAQNANGASSQATGSSSQGRNAGGDYEMVNMRGDEAV